MDLFSQVEFDSKLPVREVVGDLTRTVINGCFKRLCNLVLSVSAILCKPFGSQ